MQHSITLEDHLASIAVSAEARDAVAVVLAIAGAGRRIASLVAVGPLLGGLHDVLDDKVRGDSQKQLDMQTNEMVIEALRQAPVAVVGSEELADGLVLDPAESLAVAIDPLDGSSNIETNASIGTIFSILSAASFADDLPRALLQTGAHQIAAGFLIYGPQTSLLVSFGDGTQLFIFDRERGHFFLANARMSVPLHTSEYAINGSNYRHWDEAIRHFVDDCLAGESGPHGVDYNTRWIASMVAEAYRILVRGGVYLYPGDVRPGYGEGRLRLVYEANPIALLIEQAGGAATDGTRRILDIKPRTLHQRVPLVFGSRHAVETVAHYYDHPTAMGSRSPLFRTRSVLGG